MSIIANLCKFGNRQVGPTFSRGQRIHHAVTELCEAQFIPSRLCRKASRGRRAGLIINCKNLWLTL